MIGVGPESKRQRRIEEHGDEEAATRVQSEIDGDRARGTVGERKDAKRTHVSSEAHTGGEDCAKPRCTLIPLIVSCAIMLPLKRWLYSLLTRASLRRY